MHTIDCPVCGDPLESANYCARCDKSISSSEGAEQQSEEIPETPAIVASRSGEETIPETPVADASQPGEEENSLSEVVSGEEDSRVFQPEQEEILETPVTVPQNETLSSSSEEEPAATLPIATEKSADAPADTDETAPMPEGLSRKIRAVVPPADTDETAPMPEGLSRKVRTFIPSVDTSETVPMPQGLSRETGASPEFAETVPMPQGLSRETGASSEFAETVPLFSGAGSAGGNGRSISRSLDAPTLNLRSMRGNARAVLELDLQEELGEEDQEDDDDETVTFHDNWQKVVEHKNSSILPALPGAESGQTSRKPGLFAILPGRRSPRPLAWLGALVAIALLLSGAFGIAVSLGRTTQKVAPSLPTLQALPATIALGGIVTLRGTYFPANTELTLIRDGHIPLVDTSGASTIRTDVHGFFSDTFVVDPA